MKVLIRILRLFRLALRRVFKFLGKDPAFAGVLTFLLLLTVVAAIGYLIVPDRSVNASQGSKSIGRQPPGFEVTMLRVVDNKVAIEQSFLSKFFHGIKTNERLIPIISSQYDGTDIIIKEFSASGDSLFESRFNLADVVYAINPETKIFERNSGIFFETIDGRSAGESISDLKAIIDGQYLVKKKFLLGTDRYGRDVFSRFILSMRVTLFTALIVTLISLLAGCIWGLAGSMMPSPASKLFYCVAESIHSVPGMILSAMVVFSLGNGFLRMCCAIVLVFSAQVARLTMDKISGFRRNQFSLAAITLGLSAWQRWRIQVSSNLSRPLVAFGASLFCGAVLIECGLNFLGLGVDEIVPTWGYMIRQNFGYIVVPGYAYMTLFPGLGIMVVSFSFALLSRRIHASLPEKEHRILV